MRIRIRIRIFYTDSDPAKIRILYGFRFGSATLVITDSVVIDSVVIDSVIIDDYIWFCKDSKSYFRFNPTLHTSSAGASDLCKVT